MKIGFTSDCHIDFFESDLGLLRERNDILRENMADAEVIILSGDMCAAGDRYIDWIEEVFPNRQICIVFGNHEYYGAVKPDLDAAFGEVLVRRGLDNKISLLNPGTVSFQGADGVNVRIVGATLWTDFGVFGEKYRLFQMANAWEMMNDYNHIYKASGRLISPMDTALWHEADVEFIKGMLSEEFDGKTVVATHHAPLPDCINQRFVERNFSWAEGVAAAYINDMTDFIGNHEIALWVYGHTHFDVDMECNGTRVTSAQGGYIGQDPRKDNDLTGPGRIVEI